MKLQFKPGDLQTTLTHETKECGLCIVLTVKTTLKVDRADFVAGWIFSTSQETLAQRLKACIDAGKAFSDYEIKTDVNCKTYISAQTIGFFHKRHMNKELAKLGF